MGEGVAGEGSGGWGGKYGKSRNDAYDAYFGSSGSGLNLSPKLDSIMNNTLDEGQYDDSIVDSGDQNYKSEAWANFKNTMAAVLDRKIGTTLTQGAELIKNAALALFDSGGIDTNTFNSINITADKYKTGDIDSGQLSNSITGTIDIASQPVLSAPARNNYSESQFWNDYIDNFYGVGTPENSNYMPSYKDLATQDDAFKKEAVSNYLSKIQGFGNDRIASSETATGKYTQALDQINADIAAKKGNIGFGMEGAGAGGNDFMADFTPKSVRYNRLNTAENAKNILSADLGLAELTYGTNTGNAGQKLGFMDQLSPVKSRIDYITKLEGLGQIAKDREHKLAIARTAPEQTKSTNWLKAIGDIINIGDSGYTFYDKVFGDRDTNSKTSYDS